MKRSWAWVVAALGAALWVGVSIQTPTLAKGPKALDGSVAGRFQLLKYDSMTVVVFDSASGRVYSQQIRKNTPMDARVYDVAAAKVVRRTVTEVDE